MDLPAVDGDLQSFELSQTTRAMRGAATAPMGVVTATIALSAPFVLPLTADLVADDKELLAFWTAEKDQFRYDYVMFRVGFAPSGSPIQKAWVEVLFDPGGTGGGGSIAWSMTPDFVADQETVTEKASLKGDFKLVGGESEISREQQMKRWVMRGRMVDATKPYWEFAATDATALDGDFKLHMIVRTPIGQTGGGGTVTARAEIAGRSFLLFRRDAPTEQRAGSAFTLPVAATGAPPPGAALL